MEEEAQSLLLRPVLHIGALAALQHRHAEVDVVGLVDRVIDEVHPLGGVRAVLAHGGGDHVSEDLLAVLHRGGGAVVDIHRLGGDGADDGGIVAVLPDPQLQLLDAQVQLVP